MMYIGLKDGEIFVKFANKEASESGIFGEVDYILELDEEDIETLKKWLSE